MLEELKELQKARADILRWRRQYGEASPNVVGTFVNTAEALAQVTQTLLLAELLDEVRSLKEELQKKNLE